MRYFFGDESGTIGPKVREWFVFGGYHVTLEDYRTLGEMWRGVYKQYSIAIRCEIKHSAVSALRRDGPDPHRDNPKYQHLLHLHTDDLTGLAQSIAALVRSLDSLKVILAVGHPDVIMAMPSVANADTKLWPRHDAAKARCLGIMLQNLMQRFEMDLRQTKEEGAMHFDRITSFKAAHGALQSYHTMLVRGQGDWFVKYRHLQPTLAFQENDCHWGLQLADHICGYCAGFLRGDREAAAALGSVWPKIRADAAGRIAGRGIIGVPREAVNESMLTRMRGLR